MELNQQIDKLYSQQIGNWELLANNIKDLKHVQLKSFKFSGFSIKVQYNPKRIKSSSAKTDKQSIEKRPCFLCPRNRPVVQSYIDFAPYHILCNPFPIFDKHLTISHKNHIDQAINNSFADLLNISKAIPQYVVFFNGANCGASAPDHLHFQAGNTGLLPIENEFESICKQYGHTIHKDNNITANAINDGLRTFISIESDNKSKIEQFFDKIYIETEKISNIPPMLNILVWHDKYWRVLVFLRSKHRPSQFFENNKLQLLFSPASVDMGGTIILPREQDFNTITKELIADMMQQVSLKASDFKVLIECMKKI